MRAAGLDENGGWNLYNTLWEALQLECRICRAKQRKSLPFVLSVAGAGGKTSLIRRLAWECGKQGRTVLVTTTTHMYRPVRFGVSGGAEEARKALERQRIAVLGKPAGEKIGFPGEDACREAGRYAQVLLCEADGSRRLPLKAPGTGEPVILPGSAVILCVLGLSALGHSGGQVCHRLEAAEKICPGLGSRPVREEDMAALMGEGYLRPLRRAFPGAAVLPVFSQADTPEREAAAKRLLERLSEQTGGDAEGERGPERCRGAAVWGLREDVSAALF